MDNSLLDRLQMEHLDGEQRLLAETIGMEAYRKLVSVYGGTGRLYIPQPEMVLIPLRDTLIREEYTGDNIYGLCDKWNLSESSIRKIVQVKAAELRRAPVSGQLTFEELNAD